MQPIKFWTFILRCLAKAALESADFFELRLRTVIIGVVLVLLGFLLHWLVKGFAETREEAYKYIILVAAPAVLFLAGLLLYNAFRAPYLIYIEEYGKAQAKVEEANRAKTQAEGAQKIAEIKIVELQKQLAEKSAPIRSREGPSSETQKDDSDALRRTIQQRLGGFMTQGVALREGWLKRVGGTEEVQREIAIAIEKWHGEVERYLKTIPRGSIYLVRFQNPVRGLSGYPAGINLSLAGRWDQLTSDLARLNEFLLDPDLGKP